MELVCANDSLLVEAQSRNVGKALAPCMDHAGTDEVQIVTSPQGAGTLRVFVIRLGPDGDEGVLAAGSRQAGFPGEHERLFLDIAARQLATALQCRRAEDARGLLERERDKPVARLRKKLEQSESLLAEAQKLAHIGSWNWDIASDHVVWSDEHFRIFGMRPQEIDMTYERLLSFVHPDDRAIVQHEVNQSVRENQPFEFCYRALHRDGTVRVVHSRGQVVSDEDGNPVRMFGTAQDITEQRHADEALEESQRRFQSIFENALDGIVLFDDYANYIDANPAMCRLLGFTREELLRMKLRDVTPIPDRDRIPDDMVLFRAAGAASGKYELLCKDGTARLVEYRAVANILPGVHLGIQRDITERERAEEELRQSEERFRFLAESIPQMVWAALPDGYGDYCNSRYSDYVGVAQEQLRGHGWGETLHPEDRGRVRAAWEVSCRRGAEHRVECRIREGKTGQYRWFHVHAVPQRDAGGRIVRWYGTCTDIDDRKQAEEALRDSAECFACFPGALWTFRRRSAGTSPASCTMRSGKCSRDQRQSTIRQEGLRRCHNPADRREHPHCRPGH